MKKLTVLFLTAVIVLSGASLFAQGANPIKAGNLSAGLIDLFSYTGFASGDLYESGSDKLSVIGVNVMGVHPELTFTTIRPEVCYFFIDGLAIGGSLTYGQFKQGGSKYTVWGMGPVLYYYFKATDTIYPYATAGITFSSIKKDSNDPLTFQRIPLGAGALVMLGNNIGIYGQIIYSIDQIKEGSSDKVEGKIFDLRLGFKAYF